MTAPQTVADVLDAAADLLTPEGAWVQGKMGRTAKGHTVRVAADIDAAVCYCAAGALWKAAGGEAGGRLVFKAFGVMSNQGRTPGIGTWNDAPGRTQSEVVAALREAATSARQGEKA